LSHLHLENEQFYQDRLGTNIGKTHTHKSDYRFPLGDEMWDGVMGAVTREALCRLHAELGQAREAALPPGGFAGIDGTDTSMKSGDSGCWAVGLRVEMAVVASLQLRQLAEVDEWQRTIDEVALQADREQHERDQVELERLTSLGRPAANAALSLMIDIDSTRQRVGPPLLHCTGTLRVLDIGPSVDTSHRLVAWFRVCLPSTDS
jgi:hypothetical protein